MPRKITAPHTPESLEAMADALADYSAQLKVLAEKMRVHEFKKLDVANNDQRKRGMIFIESFLSAVHSAFREGRENRGDFQPNGLHHDTDE